MENSLYRQWQQLGIDYGPVGLEPRADSNRYFCTPVGAEIIGAPGVDGIHFCFVPGFADTVFCVSPMNTPGDYVHPVANCFADFLRLLLACGDVAAIEQAHGWSRASFEDFLRAHPPTPEQQTVLSALQTALSLTPMDDPYGYITALQAAFDYRTIPFSPEMNTANLSASYEQIAPKASSMFDGYFGFASPDPTVQSFLLDRRFEWNEGNYRVPAVYLCSEGIVVDCCAEVDPYWILAYREKWVSLLADREPTLEEQRALDSENPMQMRFGASLLLNGQELRSMQSTTTLWLPEDCRPDGDEPSETTERVLDRYRLDRYYGWVLRRFSFPWENMEPCAVQSLSLVIHPPVVSVYGEQFTNPEPGAQIPFVHPESGEKHHLQVVSCQQETISLAMLGDEQPCFVTQLCYTVTPDLPIDQLLVIDCAPPESRAVPSPEPNLVGTAAASNRMLPAASIGIIGGADGPTAVLFGGNTDRSLHTAHSMLRCDPADSVTWQLRFSVRKGEECTVPLI